MPVDDAAHRQANAQAALAGLSKQDPLYEKIRATVAASHATWAKPSPLRDEARELLRKAMLGYEAQTRSAAAACNTDIATTWGKLAPRLGLKIPASMNIEYDLMPYLHERVEVALVLGAMEYCLSDGGSSPVPLNARGNYERINGPRIAALRELERHQKAWNFDDKAASFSKLIYDAALGKPDTTGRLAYGHVKSVTHDGDQVTLTFEKKRVAHSYCDRWRKTGRLRKIHRDGSLEYQDECIKWRNTSLLEAPPNLTVPAMFGNIPTGSIVAYTGTVVILGAPSDRAKHWSYLFGAKL